ncbi:MAG: M23 family metallopeptidase [Gammaproteobacteria bacterium]
MRVLLCIAALAVAAPAAAARCSLDWVCVESRESDDGVVLVARNLKPWPLTLTAQVTSSNLKARPAAEVTRTVPGGARIELVNLEVVSPGRPWNYRFNYDWAVGRNDARHDDDYLYRLPYAGDAAWPVLQGVQTQFSHTGLEAWAVDFDMPEGSAVHAAREGIAVRVVEEHDRSCWAPGCGRYANFIVILHDDGTTGEYYHLRHEGAVVEEGQKVRRGQHIGWSGNTGKSTMPHLHFAVYRPDTWGRTQSVAVRFETRSGPLEYPVQGVSYRHPDPASGTNRAAR